ncbi:MAG: hypothetical protein MK078_16550 [Crocinitomicaceae bacterium]|nr:hypothetical protein [Crocinitomicaceae bacterium]
MLGLSYSRNKVLGPKSALNLEGSVGWGASKESSQNQFFALNPQYLLGKENTFISFGAELKAYRFTYSGLLGTAQFILADGAYQTNTYIGVSGSPTLGVSYYSSNGFTFKTRASIFFILVDGQLGITLPSVGFSFGYSL